MSHNIHEPNHVGECIFCGKHVGKSYKMAGSAQANPTDNTQAELNGIFDKMGYTKNTDFRKDAIRLITDWHNKQVEEVLDRLSNTLTGSNDFRVEPSVKLCLGVGQIVSIRSAIEGERSKLKERDDE